MTCLCSPCFLLMRADVRCQVVKPNKYPACEAVHQMYFECSLVTEASFGKFLNRCGALKEKLDECNIREQVVKSCMAVGA